MSLLSVQSHLPDRFLSARADEMLDLLGQPTLFHLSGHRTEPLFVSILLHGNEDVGLLAVQELLRSHALRELPRALSLFVGNVSAARAGVRRLDEQPDYNRIWPSSETDGTIEHAMMRAVVDEMRTRAVFASVDLHNNTGKNPHYCCVNRIDHSTLQMASLFSRTVVYFLRPKGVQSMAFATLCPSVTCECGKVGDASGVAHAAEFLQTCLHLSEIPSHPVASGDIHLFHTLATVTVPQEITFSFTDGDAELTLSPELESLNFCELTPGTRIGHRQMESLRNLMVRDEQGRDVTDEFLVVDPENVIRLRCPAVPAMLTLNERVIRQDCLGYFMERLSVI